MNENKKLMQIACNVKCSADERRRAIQKLSPKYLKSLISKLIDNFEYDNDVCLFYRCGYLPYEEPVDLQKALIEKMDETFLKFLLKVALYHDQYNEWEIIYYVVQDKLNELKLKLGKKKFAEKIIRIFNINKTALKDIEYPEKYIKHLKELCRKLKKEGFSKKISQKVKERINNILDLMNQKKEK